MFSVKFLSMYNSDKEQFMSLVHIRYVELPFRARSLNNRSQPRAVHEPVLPFRAHSLKNCSNILFFLLEDDSELQASATLRCIENLPDNHPYGQHCIICIQARIIFPISQHLSVPKIRFHHRNEIGWMPYGGKS